MVDRLSFQIRAFRAEWARFEGGVTLSAEAVEAFEALFTAFQAQAVALETERRFEIGRERMPLPQRVEACIAMAQADVEAIDRVVRDLAEANVRLASAPRSNVMPFSAGGRP